MFVVLYDEYGTIYNAESCGTYETMEEAIEAMKELVKRDCDEFEESFEDYEYTIKHGYMHTPRGMDDPAYKVIEVPDKKATTTAQQEDAMYHIYLVWNGNKKQIAEQYDFENRREWQWTIQHMPYDIIDEDDRNCWVDFGDL